MLEYFVIAPCGLKYTAWGSLHGLCLCRTWFQGFFLTETCNYFININLSDIPCPPLSYDPSLSHVIEPAQCSRISHIYWNCQLLERVACTVIFIWGFFECTGEQEGWSAPQLPDIKRECPTCKWQGNSVKCWSKRRGDRWEGIPGRTQGGTKVELKC